MSSGSQSEQRLCPEDPCWALEPLSIDVVSARSVSQGEHSPFKNKARLRVANLTSEANSLSNALDLPMRSK